MSNVYVTQTLPWDPLPGESNRLRVLMAIMLVLAFLIWLIVPHIKIPEVKRAEAEAVPERLAKMVVQQKVTPPPPKKVEEVKPDENLPKVDTKPAEVAEKAPKAVVTDLQKSAAKARASKAIQDAGINDALADIRDMDVTAMAAPRGLPGQSGSGTGGNLITSTEEAGTSRNLLTSRAGSGSGAGNAYAGGVSSGFGGGKAGGKGSAGMLGAGVAGGSGKLQSVNSGIGTEATNVNGRVGKDGKSRRTAEDIRKTFDQYGGRLNNLYQRALRDDPTMQGTVRLKLTVSPDGSVSGVSVASSQLNNSELEAKILAVVKGFNFGAYEVEIWSGTHDLNFFPN
ncbi:MAG TPA: TonB family protein [Moraxellaceae bacterium]